MAHSIRQIRLDLLRSGPSHNQFLSPLVPYIALCGAASPQTVYMPYEQRQLLTRLQRLRYEVDGAPVPAAQREAELRELGEAMGQVLGQMAAMQSALDDATRDSSKLVHLRLVANALELGMLPFETAIAPDNLPGSGGPLLLRSPTILTREIRRAQPIEVQWDREPRILFAFANPGALAEVPAKEHLKELRAAIDPLLKIVDDQSGRLEQVRGLLTVLPNATLEDITAACRRQEYTHVHLLAHGVSFREGVSERFGIALHAPADAGRPIDEVSGERLALALRGVDSSSEQSRPLPTVVTLATCDSGAVGSLLTPGGSIAHELHEAGVPWVIASQFPLWMRASTVAVGEIYRSLLRGDDPRWMLFALRQQLRTKVPQTHDWASIVAYAVTPWELDDQVDRFCNRQFARRIWVLFDRFDSLLRRRTSGGDTPAIDAELDQRCAAIRAEHTEWLRPLPTAQCTAPDAAAVAQFAERLGNSAASEKRIAIAYSMIGNKALAEQAYKQSIEQYNAALQRQHFNHWVATQYLSLRAVTALQATQGASGESDKALLALRDELSPLWHAACQLAAWDLRRLDGENLAWAHGTLAELELLGCAYGGRAFKEKPVKVSIAQHAARIVEIVGPSAFAVASTRRQFKRYIENWPNERWSSLALSVVNLLPEKDR